MILFPALYPWRPPPTNKKKNGKPSCLTRAQARTPTGKGKMPRWTRPALRALPACLDSVQTTPVLCGRANSWRRSASVPFIECQECEHSSSAIPIDTRATRRNRFGVPRVESGIMQTPGRHHARGAVSLDNSMCQLPGRRQTMCTAVRWPQSSPETPTVSSLTHRPLN